MLLAILFALGLCALGVIVFLYRPRMQPLLFLAALITAASACALAACGRQQGFVFARYSAPPEDTAKAFLAALERGEWTAARGFLGGVDALALENTPDDEADALLFEALRESYSFRPLGPAETRGLSASQDYEYATLDLDTLQRDARGVLLGRLEAVVTERPYREVYDETGAYLPAFTDELYLDAVRQLLGERERYGRRAVLRLSLRYDEGVWRIVPDAALIDALGGLPGSLESALHNGKSGALDGLVFIRKRYTIPETALAAPPPDPAGFGSSADPAVLQEVIDGAAILLDGQETVWNAQIEPFPGSEFSWYYDDSILAICWKELVGGKCCSFAEIRIADGSQLRRKLTGDVYDSPRREYASRLAEDANAVVASNADFYAFRPYGVTVYQRTLYRFDSWHLDTCFITADGDMLMVEKAQLRNKQEIEAFIADNDVVFALSFGPILIRDGKLTVPAEYQLGEILENYSRSLLGMTDELHYLVMTVNFDEGVYKTATLAEAAQILRDRGCVKGYALDGGQTAQIWMNGRTINHIDYGAERPVSDILYFASAIRREGGSEA